MDASVTALVIAIVGVVGTLLSPIVSQRLSLRARREEFEIQRFHRQEEFDRERVVDLFTQKRSCYISFLSVSRRYRLELAIYLFTIKRGAVNDDANTRLENARLAFDASFAETQLTASFPVLEVAMKIRDGLSEGYRRIRRLEETPSRSNDSHDALDSFLLELWDAWPPLRIAMRADLGVKD